MTHKSLSQLLNVQAWRYKAMYSVPYTVRARCIKVLFAKLAYFRRNGITLATTITEQQYAILYVKITRDGRYIGNADIIGQYI